MAKNGYILSPKINRAIYNNIKDDYNISSLLPDVKNEIEGIKSSLKTKLLYIVEIKSECDWPTYMALESESDGCFKLIGVL